MTSAAAETEDAATTARASGSSFYAAMRILPAAQRAAMFEIYNFCRAVDDIADEAGPLPLRSAALAGWRTDIDGLYADPAPERTRSRLLGLAAAIRDFDLRRDDFIAVIDGMEMDLVEDIQAPEFDKLDLYCDRVASAVGRLGVRVFGVPGDLGPSLAHHLGRAFQFTNILRDIDEDAAIGRLYLPRESLEAAGITATAPETVIAHPGLAKACEPLIGRAQVHFREGKKIMALCPRVSVRAPRIMAEVYGAILEGLIRRGFSPPRVRVRTPRHRVLLALLRYGLL